MREHTKEPVQSAISRSEVGSTDAACVPAKARLRQEAQRGALEWVSAWSFRLRCVKPPCGWGCSALGVRGFSASLRFFALRSGMAPEEIIIG